MWPKLGWWMRFRVALTLRYYVYQLRSIPFETMENQFPGPPEVDRDPQLCYGPLFNMEGSGPFYTYGAMSRWYQKRLLFMERRRGVPPGTQPFDDTGPLVFTHFDLHPGNVLLGDDGQLWVIDWEVAGWYPTWFEGASVHMFLANRPTRRDTLASFGPWISFIAGDWNRPGQLR